MNEHDKKWCEQRGWRYTGKFDEWIKRHGIGPGGMDEWRANRNGTPLPEFYYDGNGWVGEGWIGILDKLVEDLKAMGWDGRLDQVKEKFGALRFYPHSYPKDPALRDSFIARLDKATFDSGETCENCGAPGVARGATSNRAWLKTLCNDCDDKVSK